MIKKIISLTFTGQVSHVTKNGRTLRFTNDGITRHSPQIRLGIVFDTKTGPTDTSLIAVKNYRHRENIARPSKDSFKSERHILNLLNGEPHIIQTRGDFSANQQHYLCLEYFNCGDLQTFMPHLFEIRTHNESHHNTLIRHFIFQLLSALNELHRHEVIHRDFKLENVLLRSPDPKTSESFASIETLALCDFEFATTKTLADRDPYFRILGTPGHIPPEILFARFQELSGNHAFFQQYKYQYTYETDVYSLGVVLAELINGRRLFEQKDLDTQDLFSCQKAFLSQHGLKLTSLAQDPSLNDTEQRLMTLVIKMLQPDPAKRPTAAALLSEFNSIFPDDIASTDVIAAWQYLEAEFPFKLRNDETGILARLGSSTTVTPSKPRSGKIVFGDRFIGLVMGSRFGRGRKGSL